ncbi:hypothetical protein ACFQZS_05010 [Mucilaginibacter calamicampi]|uniref:Uncharacterized protein n=1 Tax=Mucilaginibacter calamicampi TaxID=1302352 RepID=A0ABW2YYG0_9SPHI
MENWMYYTVAIFVIVMIYLLAFGGAAMVGGKFDNWKSRVRQKRFWSFRWKRKRLERY